MGHLGYWARVIILFLRLFILQPILAIRDGITCSRVRKKMPPSARWIYWQARLIPFLLFIIVFAIFSHLFMNGLLPPGSAIVFPFLMLMPSVAGRIFEYRERRFESEVIRDGGKRCLVCGYSLIGLPGKHICPECGVEYELSRVQQLWEDYFRELARYR